MVNKKNNNKKSQSFSTDVIIVVVIILFGTLFLVINKINDVESKTIEEVQEVASKDSDLIYDSLKKSEIIQSDGVIDGERLLSLDDQQLKEELGISNDFAITFEKEGKLVKIGNKNCIGSTNIIVNGQICE